MLFFAISWHSILDVFALRPYCTVKNRYTLQHITLIILHLSLHLNYNFRYVGFVFSRGIYAEPPNGPGFCPHEARLRSRVRV